MSMGSSQMHSTALVCDHSEYVSPSLSNKMCTLVGPVETPLMFQFSIVLYTAFHASLVVSWVQLVTAT